MRMRPVPAVSRRIGVHTDGQGKNGAILLSRCGSTLDVRNRRVPANTLRGDVQNACSHTPRAARSMTGCGWRPYDEWRSLGGFIFSQGCAQGELLALQWGDVFCWSHVPDAPDFLGHANITTTSRYLRSTTLRLERALGLLERAEGEKSRLRRNGVRPVPEKVPHRCHTPPMRNPTRMLRPSPNWLIRLKMCW
jgi:hypothetical protein